MDNLDTTEAVEAPVSTDEPAHTEPVSEAAEAPAPSETDDLSAVWDKMQDDGDDSEPHWKTQPRENGKFTKPAGEEGEDTEQPAAEAQPEQPAPSKPPASWEEAVNAKWQSLDDDTRQLISHRDNEFRQTKQQLDQVVQVYQPVDQVFGKHKDYLQQVAGQDVPGYLDKLLTYSHQLDRDPVGTLQALAQQYNVDLFDIAMGNDTQQANPQISALEQRIEQLQSQLGQFDQQRQQAEQRQQQETQRQFETSVNAFFQEHPDAVELSAEIEAEIAAVRYQNPGLSPSDVLKTAYERASWANPQSRSKRLAAEAEKAEKARADAAKKQAQQAKRANGINVRGAASAHQALSLDDDLGSTWDRLHS